ncbi:MAG: thiamine phosphate synthase [Myxococcales bacterium]|nr:thiamine phosphate synthase [Myxococcales bacterium]MCB9520760.1 thiamine phosphate synthase [Myxococcales bacterium]MCB9533477.1 thiamine phosphate synthase [Myxococcales bacterium]
MESRRPPVPRLFAIVDVAECVARSIDPLGLVAAIAGTQFPALVLRARGGPAGELLPLADATFRLCRYTGTVGILAGDIDVAAAAGAAGVHLAAAGPPVSAARAALGPDALVGASVHGHAELVARGAVGRSELAADYVFAAPVFAPTSKVSVRPPLDLEGLASLCRSSAVPVVALGGVTTERVGAVVAAGAHGVAALGAFATPTAAAVARAYATALRRAA